MKVTSRKDQKEKTRAGLILQAEELFAKYGIAQTTTADIAKGIKVSHGTLFLHFPTRDQLIEAVVDAFGERLSSAWGARCDEDADLRDLLKGHLSVLKDFEDFYLRLVCESQSLPAHVRSIFYSMNASLSYRMFRAARRDMDAGRFKKMTQAHLFNTWMGLVHYYIMNRDLFSERTPILGEVGDDLVKHYFNLIKN